MRCQWVPCQNRRPQPRHSQKRSAQAKLRAGTRPSASRSPTAVAANACPAQSFTVAGVAAGDMFVAVQKPNGEAGLNVDDGHVTGSTAATINFCNHTSSSITPTASETYTVLVAQ